MLPVKISDSGTNHTAKVTKFGQLVTSPIAYSQPIAAVIEVADTAFNFISPRQGKQIVITDILLSTSRSAPTAGTLINVYQA